jgi:pSer/pThr/pTyr-binding forkhead associated (FHA) protein
MILCPNCLREQDDGAKFCEACGAPIQASITTARKTGRPAYIETLRPAEPDTLFTAASADAAIAPPAPNGAAPSTSVPAEGGPALFGGLRVRLNTGHTFDLRGKLEYLVGRRDDVLGVQPDLDTTAYGGVDAGVSRTHALIHARHEGFFIEDLGSTNETLLNFFRLLPKQLYPLKDGDQLRFGMLQALVIIE